MSAAPKGNTLPERVAILEAQMEDLRTAVDKMVTKEGHIEAAVNTLLVNFSTLNQAVTTIVNERSVWKNPLVYISLASVMLAAITVYGK